MAVELIPETYDPFSDGNTFLDTLREHQTNAVAQQQIDILQDQIGVVERWQPIQNWSFSAVAGFLVGAMLGVFLLERRMKKLQASISKLDKITSGKTDVGS